jgi:hypothetical protein
VASSVPLDERQTKNGPLLVFAENAAAHALFRIAQTERMPFHHEAQLEVIDVISSTYYAASGLSHPATLNRTGTQPRP